MTEVSWIITCVINADWSSSASPHERQHVVTQAACRQSCSRSQMKTSSTPRSLITSSCSMFSNMLCKLIIAVQSSVGGYSLPGNTHTHTHTVHTHADTHTPGRARSCSGRSLDANHLYLIRQQEEKYVFPPSPHRGSPACTVSILHIYIF